MATIQELSSALVKADAAGNTSDAKALADAIRSMQAVGGSTQATPAPQQGGYNSTLVSQGLSGINEGIANTIGGPVDLTNMVLRGGAAALHAVGGPDIQLPEHAFGGSQTFRDAMGGVGAIGAPTDDPTGKFVRRVGQEVGGSLIPGMGIVGKAAAPVRAAVRQGVMALSSGTGAAALDQVSGNNPYADMAGQILGGGLFAGGLTAAQKAVSPFGGISPGRAAANATMRGEGIDLTAGQQTGNKYLQNTESVLGGGTTQNMTERQQQQFTAAALAKAGVSAEKATPPVMDKAFNDIGQQFETLGKNNSLQVDPQFATDIRDVWKEYDANTNANTRPPLVQNTLTGIAQKAQNSPTLPGTFYTAQVSEINRAIRASSDPQVIQALKDTKSALDAAMERSMQAANSPDLGAFQQARADYRNLLVIENAVGKAGPAAADGIITPANLAASAKAVQGKRAYVRGQGDFNDLSRAGVQTMTPLPDSGTAPRLAVRSAVTGLGAAAGLLAAGQPIAAAATAGALAAPRIAGGLMMSGIGQKYLANQAWTGSLGLGKAAVGPAVSTMTRLSSEASTDPNDPNSIRLRALN